MGVNVLLLCLENHLSWIHPKTVAEPLFRGETALAEITVHAFWE